MHEIFFLGKNKFDKRTNCRSKQQVEKQLDPSGLVIVVKLSLSFITITGPFTDSVTSDGQGATASGGAPTRK